MAEIQSLARGLKILDILAHSEEGASITELALVLNIDKASASRLMATLAHYGYAERDQRTRRFHLGSQVVSLSRSVLLRMPLREAAKPFLHLLMEKTGECAHLAVPSNQEALYVDQVESPATLRVNVEVGKTAPLHCTALGKVLLAFGGLPVPEHLPAFTPHTITQPGQLKRHLKQIYLRGYAVDDEEYDAGVRCIAAPVSDFREKLVGAIGISGPASRLTQDSLPHLARLVADTASRLTEKMKFSRGQE
jgi:IclR family transcriptional regulator, KDG regulon repressor